MICKSVRCPIQLSIHTSHRPERLSSPHEDHELICSDLETLPPPNLMTRELYLPGRYDSAHSRPASPAEFPRRSDLSWFIPLKSPLLQSRARTTPHLPYPPAYLLRSQLYRYCCRIHWPPTKTNPNQANFVNRTFRMTLSKRRHPPLFVLNLLLNQTDHPSWFREVSEELLTRDLLVPVPTLTVPWRLLGQRRHGRFNRIKESPSRRRLSNPRTKQVWCRRWIKETIMTRTWKLPH